MTVIKFPTKLPSPGQLDLAQATLCGLLQDMAGRSLARCNEVIKAGNAPELAAVIRGVADDAASDSAGWAELLMKIRESWGISP
jgi:hypothetical protein